VFATFTRFGYVGLVLLFGYTRTHVPHGFTFYARSRLRTLHTVTFARSPGYGFVGTFTVVYVTFWCYLWFYTRLLRYYRSTVTVGSRLRLVGCLPDFIRYVRRLRSVGYTFYTLRLFYVYTRVCLHGYTHGFYAFHVFCGFAFFSRFAHGYVRLRLVVRLLVYVYTIHILRFTRIRFVTVPTFTFGLPPSSCSLRGRLDLPTLLFCGYVYVYHGCTRTVGCHAARHCARCTFTFTHTAHTHHCTTHHTPFPITVRCTFVLHTHAVGYLHTHHCLPLFSDCGFRSLHHLYLIYLPPTFCYRFCTWTHGSCSRYLRTAPLPPTSPVRTHALHTHHYFFCTGSSGSARTLRFGYVLLFTHVLLVPTPRYTYGLPLPLRLPHFRLLRLVTTFYLHRYARLPTVQDFRL